MKTAIIVCTIAPYEAPKAPGEEIWALNGAFLKPISQNNIDRLYFMDPLSVLETTWPDYARRASELDCPVFCQEHYPEIPLSRPLPLNEMLLELRNYFQSTISYMMAHAIFECYDRIVMHRTNSFIGSQEYIHQKACHDYWCGVAEGRGIKVEMTGDSLIGKPHPWCAPMYGFTEREHERKANKVVRRGLQEAAKISGRVIGEFNGATVHL